MKAELKENGGLPAHILWTLAIVAGISVANLYYNQPLLNVIRHELGVSEFKTNLIAMITQVGYALGLLFIVPLGDLYQRKKIILINFTLLIFSLIAIATAPNIYIIWGASLITGICSMIPQIFVPIASQFSRPENKGRDVCVFISGLLTGILASRVISGFIGEALGWREMYFIAAGMMLLCATSSYGLAIAGMLALNWTIQFLCGERSLIKNKQRFAGLVLLLVFAYQRLPCPTHLLHTRRHRIRLFLSHVVVSRFQNGRSAFLCQQRCNRHFGAVRNSRCTDRIFRWKVCEKSRDTQL